MDRARRAAILLPVSAALAAAFAILFIPLTLPLLVWRIFPFGDLSAFHTPMRFIYREALRAGDSFLWTSTLGSGLYLHAEGQTGMAHPAHLLLYRVLPLTAAINLEMLAAYGAATTGLWLLLRGLGIRGDAALGGALVFAFGGFMLPHLNHLAAIVVAAHIPWIVLFADLLLGGSFRLKAEATRSEKEATRSDSSTFRLKAEATRSENSTARLPSEKTTTWLPPSGGRTAALGFAGVALTLGSQVLLGFPQVVWMTAVILGWFVVYRIRTGTRLSRVALFVFALAFGLAIGGVQLLPTLDAARESFRSATTVAFRMSFSLHPLNVVQLFSPYALKDGVYAPTAEEWFPHELSIYAGALATMSVAWVLARRRSLAQRGLATAFLCLGAIGFVLALGRYGGIYPLLANLPVLSSFRGSARHILIVHFALAGLVALTLHDLLERPADARRPRWALAVPVAISIALTAVAVFGAGWAAARGVAPGRPTAALLGLAFALTTAFCMARAARGSRHAVAALVVVAAADIACWGLPYAYAEAPKPIGLLEPPRGRPPGSQRNDLVHPEHDLGEMNRYPMIRLRSQLAYLGLVPSYALDQDSPIAQRIAGVKWTWTPSGWAPLADTMPRARLVTDWRVSRDTAADIGAIDIARTALVDASPGSAPGPPGEARMIQERAGRLRVDTAAPSEQLLVVTERFHTGWIVRIDGVPAATRRVYGDYLGCVVPAGSHVVSFVFSPASTRYGLWVSIAGLTLTALFAFVLVKHQIVESGVAGAGAQKR